MAKNTYLFLCSGLLIVTLCSFNNRSLRPCVVACAKDEIGVKERTGNNDGERVERYLQETGLKKGNPWCAAVQAYLYSCCNIKNPKSAYCPDWFRKKDVIYQRNTTKKDFDVCRPGDLFGLWFTEKGRIAHMGMIEKVEGQKVTTLEGNTNDEGGRDGDGFYRKYRLKNQIFAVANHIKD